MISNASSVFIGQAMSNLFDISQQVESKNVTIGHYPGDWCVQPGYKYQK